MGHVSDTDRRYTNRNFQGIFEGKCFEVPHMMVLFARAFGHQESSNDRAYPLVRVHTMSSKLEWLLRRTESNAIVSNDCLCSVEVKGQQFKV